MGLGRSLRIFTDGGSSGNPGKAAASFVVYEGDDLLILHGEALGSRTNNFAEYKALDMALKWLKDSGYPVEHVEIFCDSELVVKQLRGEYRVKSRNLKDLYRQVKARLLGFRSVRVSWIPREENRLADWLVKTILKGEKRP